MAEDEEQRRRSGTLERPLEGGPLMRDSTFQRFVMDKWAALREKKRGEDNYTCPREVSAPGILPPRRGGYSLLEEGH